MPSILTKKNLLSSALLILTYLVFLILYNQALNHLWRGHLEVDTWNYYLKIADILKQHSFFTKIGNEIFPATTIFLLIPGFFVSHAPFNYSAYLSVFFILILLTLAYHIFLAAKYASVNHALMFSLLMLFFGPILLFRFDVLAALLVVLSLLSFQQKKFLLSALFLGLVTSIKVYPVIFLPYLLLILLNKRRFKLTASYLAGFSFALILPIFIFLSAGGTIAQITEGLNFHSLKYVSIESLPGSLITLSSVLTQGYPSQLIGGWGVWGITSPLIKHLGLNFFNEFWVLPVAVFYLILLTKKSLLAKFNFNVIFSLMLLFLVFSKNLHAQYVWWFLSLFPFLPVKQKSRFKYLLMFLLLIFICLFNQLVYPLFYTKFITDFYQYNQAYAVFYCLLLRNLLIVILTVVSFQLIL